MSVIAQSDAATAAQSGAGSLFWFIVGLIIPAFFVAYAIWLMGYARRRRRFNDEYAARLQAHMRRNEEQLDGIGKTLDAILAELTRRDA